MVNTLGFPVYSLVISVSEAAGQQGSFSASIALIMKMDFIHTTLLALVGGSALQHDSKIHSMGPPLLLDLVRELCGWMTGLRDPRPSWLVNYTPL